MGGNLQIAGPSLLLDRLKGMLVMWMGSQERQGCTTRKGIQWMKEEIYMLRTP